MASSKSPSPIGPCTLKLIAGDLDRRFNLKQAYRLCRLVFEQCGINQPDSKTFNFHFQRQAVLTLNGEVNFSKLIAVFEKLAKMQHRSEGVLKHTLVTQPAFDREFNKLNMN